jgi:predicted Rossmann-fold nucleotide-binding protein
LTSSVRRSPRARRIAAVIGSGRVADPHCDEIGRLIATLGFDLLTGGGRGVMEAVSRAFSETSPRAGLVIGVVPGRVHELAQIEEQGPQRGSRAGVPERTATKVTYESPAGYPNEWVEIAIYTHLPDTGEQGTLRSSRNHINVLSADAIVALPGREGTESEIFLAKQYGVPIIAYGDHDPRPAGIPHAPSLDEVRKFLIAHRNRD